MVAALREHDVHELRGEVRGEGARKGREQPLREVQHARHAVRLQPVVGCMSYMCSLD